MTLNGVMTVDPRYFCTAAELFAVNNGDQWKRVSTHFRKSLTATSPINSEDMKLTRTERAVAASRLLYYRLNRQNHSSSVFLAEEVLRIFSNSPITVAGCG